MEKRLKSLYDLEIIHDKLWDKDILTVYSHIFWNYIGTRSVIIQSCVLRLYSHTLWDYIVIYSEITQLHICKKQFRNPLRLKSQRVAHFGNLDQPI